MARRTYTRFFLYTAYTGALLALMLYGYVRLTGFEGYLRVLPGQAENIAFADAEGIAPFAPEFILPPDLVPFKIADTPRHLARDTDLIHRALPFSLSVSTVDILETYPPQHQLLIQHTGPTRTVPVQVGDTVNVGESPLQVVAIEPWQGLVRDIRGLPSMALHADDGARAGTLLMESGQWAFPAPDMAVRLHWHPSAQAQQQAVQEAARPGIEAAWWTLDDGGATTRFNNFTPGAGAECEDGSVWLVEKLEEQPAPRLLLRVEQGGVVRRETLVPNADTPEARARFFHPGAAAVCIELHAWREGEAVAVVHGDGNHELKAGALLPGNGPVQLRLLQLLAHGLPAQPQEPPVQQLTLRDNADAEWRIREGSSEMIAHVRVAYARQAPPPKQRLQLHAAGPDSFQQDAALAPGDTRAVGVWKLSLAEGNPSDERGIYLRVRKNLFPPHVIVGLTLFIAASFVLLYLRFAPRR